MWVATSSVAAELPEITVSILLLGFSSENICMQAAPQSTTLFSRGGLLYFLKCNKLIIFRSTKHHMSVWTETVCGKNKLKIIIGRKIQIITPLQTYTTSLYGGWHWEHLNASLQTVLLKSGSAAQNSTSQTQQHWSKLLNNCKHANLKKAFAENLLRSWVHTCWDENKQVEAK